MTMLIRGSFSIHYPDAGFGRLGYNSLSDARAAAERDFALFSDLFKAEVMFRGILVDSLFPEPRDATDE